MKTKLVLKPGKLYQFLLSLSAWETDAMYNSPEIYHARMGTFALLLNRKVVNIGGHSFYGSCDIGCFLFPTGQVGWVVIHDHHGNCFLAEAPEKRNYEQEEEEA